MILKKFVPRESVDLILDTLETEGVLDTTDSDKNTTHSWSDGESINMVHETKRPDIRIQTIHLLAEAKADLQGVIIPVNSVVLGRFGKDIDPNVFFDQVVSHSVGKGQK